MLKAWVE